jgi:hypothetical protein
VSFTFSFSLFLLTNYTANYTPNIHIICLFLLILNERTFDLQCIRTHLDRRVGIHISLALVFNCLKHTSTKYECVYNTKQNDVMKKNQSTSLHLVLFSSVFFDINAVCIYYVKEKKKAPANIRNS